MEYFSIKNWERFQHYKDRNPPWIKLHKEVIDDYDICCLQDASRLLQILLWVLASQLNNRIPADCDWLQRRLSLRSKINLKELIDKGFIVMEQNASVMLAKPEQLASPETETEAEAETETETEERDTARAKKKISLEELTPDHIKDWLDEKRKSGIYIHHDAVFVLDKLRNHCAATGKKYKDYVAAYRNAFDWSNCKPPRTNGNGFTRNDQPLESPETIRARMIEKGLLKI